MFRTKVFWSRSKTHITTTNAQKLPSILLVVYWKINTMRRQDPLRPSTHEENTKLRLITNYNPNNPDLRAIIKKYVGLLLMTRKSAIRPEDINPFAHFAAICVWMLNPFSIYVHLSQRILIIIICVHYFSKILSPILSHNSHSPHGVNIHIPLLDKFLRYFGLYAARWVEL